MLLEQFSNKSLYDAHFEDEDDDWEIDEDLAEGD
jgi:hypothetical protein